jgi:NitT/TauT family transport system ATP-binding protein
MASDVEAALTGLRAGSADVVVLAGVAKAYGPVQALAGVDLRVAAHELIAVAGPSGCGKSTLLELVCGLAAPDAGTVSGPPAALMPQRDALLPWLSALDNAALAARVAGASRAQARAAAHAHFAAFGLEGFERARPAQLSGGMRQRVAFLRTLLAGRPVLCLDEPFGALDALTRAQAQGWLADALEREPRTVLLVTHDVEEAVLLADRVLLLSPRPGRVVATLDVTLPRPRRRTDRAVVELRERALAALGAAG